MIQRLGTYSLLEDLNNWTVLRFYAALLLLQAQVSKILIQKHLAKLWLNTRPWKSVQTAAWAYKNTMLEQTHYAPAVHISTKWVC